MQIRLLGGLQIVPEQSAVRFCAPAKAAALLAYLILHRSQSSLRDTVAFALWPDDEEGKARANLRRHIALLQRALPASEAPFFFADQRSMHWNALHDGSVDVCEFELYSARSDAANRAADLYSGDLLPESLEEWMLPDRERLRSLQTTNLERMMGEFRLGGDYPSAIAAAKRLLEHDPWREDTVRYIMSLRYDSGDRAGALQEYERFAVRLHGEMRVSPMPETRARRDAIVRNQQTAVIRDPLPPPNAVEVMPFVGRSAEMQRLTDCWSRAMRGHGRMAFVSGEAGIGKTRLSSEFANLVESQGGRVIYGSSTFAEAVPYQAIVEALRFALPMIAALDLKPIYAAAASALLPELLHTYRDLPQLATLEPEREQARLFEAMWVCLEAAARIRPLLVVLEDLHWAGHATIAFLNYIAGRIAAAPIILLLTHRENEIEVSHPLRALRRRALGEGRAVAMALAGLSQADVEQILQRNSGVPHVDVFAAEAHALSGGNPFFLSELVRESMASGDPIPVLPKSLQRAIAARIARLSPAVRPMLDVAATAGPAFNAEIVAEAGGFAEHDVAQYLDELLDLRLIHASTRDGAERPYDFSFSHHLIQAHVYAEVPETVRRIMHRRIGAVIERLYGGSIVPLARELARHYDLGGAAGKAATHYYAWAQRALDLHADDEALAALSRAAILCADAQTLYAILDLRESVYARAGSRENQLRDIERLDALALESGDAKHLLQTQCRRILYARAIGDIAGQQAATHRLRKLTAGTQERYWIAFRMESEAISLRALGQYRQAMQKAKASLTGYAACGDSAGRVRALCLVADVCGLLAMPRAAAEAIDEGLLLAARSSNEAQMIGALDGAARSAYRNDDYDACEERSKKGLALCRTTGDREGEADACFRLGNVFGRRFVVDKAIEQFERAAVLYDAVNKPLGTAMVLANTGVLHLKVGDFDLAVRSFVRARVIFFKLRDLRGRTICSINLGMAAYCMARYGSARRISSIALKLANELNTPALICAAMANMGAAERELGDVPAALAHCEESMRLRREKAAVDIASDLADLGLTYLAASNLPAAVQIALEICALETKSLESVMYPQDVMWSAAQIFAAAGQDDRYREALSRACSLRAARIEAIPAGRSREMYREMRCNREIFSAASPQSDGVRTANVHTSVREHWQPAHQAPLRH